MGTLAIFCRLTKKLIWILLILSFIGCAKHLYHRWDAQLKQMMYECTVDDVSLLLGTPPYKCEALEDCEVDMQCYWYVPGGIMAKPGGAAWSSYSGVATSGAVYERFYRLTCRFRDGLLVQFRSNWQK